MPNSRLRAEVHYLAYQPPFYAIYYMSGGCDVTSHHYGENPPSFRNSWATAILQVDMPSIKPAHNT